MGWNAEKQLVLLTRNETRDTMTATDLLVKSNQAVMGTNTYSMAGDIKMTMGMEADGEKMEGSPLSMNTKLEGQIQSNPMQVSMKMKMTPLDKGVVPETTMETYMTEDRMYMKAPGQEWMVQDLPFSKDFWNQQKDIQSDPLKAVAQMKEMGMLLNFGNDLTLNGQEYYVINTTLDMNKFRQGYQKIVGQIMQSVPQTTGANPEEMQSFMEKIMDKMSIDHYYTAYINKKTLICDVINIDAKMNMTFNPAEFAKEISPDPQNNPSGEKVPQEIKINMVLQGVLQSAIWTSPSLLQM